MSVKIFEVKIRGSAVMPDDDTILNIGGTIDRTKKITFADLSIQGTVEIVSSAVADISQTVDVIFRDSAGAKLTEQKTLSGQTPVAFSSTMERLLKALKTGSTAGDVAVMASTAERTGTAQGGTTDSIQLDAGASSVNGFFIGFVCRLTGGTGAQQIREIVAYDGATKVATVNRIWGTDPDATTVFRIARGMLFDLLPVEIDEVRRPFFNAAADPPGGSQRDYFDKFFFDNTQPATGGLALTLAVISEVTDVPGVVDFDLEPVLDGSTTNGAGNNRQVAPSGFTFDSAAKNVANSQTHSPASAQGVWLRLRLAAGAAAQKFVYEIKEQGNTV